MHTDTVLSFFVYNLKFKDANDFVAFSRGADTSSQTPRSELLIAQFTKNESQSDSLLLVATIPAVRSKQKLGSTPAIGFPRNARIGFRRPATDRQATRNRSACSNQRNLWAGEHLAGEWMSDSLPSILHVSYTRTPSIYYLLLLFRNENGEQLVDSKQLAC